MDSCILSKFYIKPQPINMLAKSDGVVSYRNSTSNHNIHAVTVPQQRVVSYRNSTSNHNSAAPATAPPVLYLIEILHQTTTFAALAPLLLGCILSKFYIKPQLRQGLYSAYKGCILSKFYIKPQQCEKQS